MVDNREAWQIEYSIRVQIAASYLTELDLARTDPQRAAVYCAAYKIMDGGLERWAKEQIERAICKANTILAEHNLGGHTTAPSVDARLLERLAEMGLNGIVPIEPVGTTKTSKGAAPSADVSDLVDAARLYEVLYERWWSSVMRGPYNGSRDAEHWELVHDRQLAWQRFADLLRAHGLVPSDRRAFARALALGV